MKKILLLLLFGICLTTQSFALELDTAVDEEIRKHYNPNKIEQDVLPPLPKTNTQHSSPTAATPLPPKNLPSVPETKSNKSGRIQNLPGQSGKNLSRDGIAAIKLKKGTKFKVRSLTSVSDSTPVNSGISFKTTESVTQRYVTIPAGTVFKAKVENSHTPQMSGNGGLIVININGMVFRGQTRKIEAKVTKANGKKIFVNNIKGKRQYLKGVAKSTKPGAKFYRKSMRGTAKLAQNPWTLILTPFTAVSGVVVYGVNIVGSPVFAVFSKGGRITIPAGTDFEIKLLEDVYLD